MQPQAKKLLRLQPQQIALEDTPHPTWALTSASGPSGQQVVLSKAQYLSGRPQKTTTRAPPGG